MSTHAIGRWPARLLAAILLLSQTAAAPAGGAVGDVDPDFGDAGAIRFDGSANVTPFIFQTVAQEDGGVLIAGFARVVVASPPNGVSEAEVLFVSRHAADGSPEPGFGTNGGSRVVVGDPGTLSVISAAAAPDGRTLVAFNESQGGVPAAVVVRLTPDGQADPAFGVGGRALVPLTRLAAPIATLSDGSVLVAGFLGASQLGLVHLLADGSPDQQFGQGGVATLIPVIFGSSATMRLLVQPDGRIVIVAIEGGTIIRVLRREPDGSPDAGFAEGDVVEVIGQRLLDVASAADGGVRVATLSRRLLTDDEGLVNLSVLRPDGTSAGTATVPAVMANPNARGIAGVYQADGKLLLVDQGAAAPALRRLNADGTVDVEPQELGALAGLITQEIALRPDGSLLVRAAPPPGSAIVSTIVARVEATACGNGIVEPGESCDEGVGRNGSPDGCCSATCAAAPDQDGDGICDARDLCTDVDGGRGFDAGSTLRLRRANVQDPAEDRLLLVAQIRLPPGTTFSTLDPENEGFRLVLTDQTGATSLDVALPAGSFAGRGTRGWQRRRAGRRLKYRDLTDAPLGGIRTVRIDDDATTPGEVTVTVRGARGGYPVSADAAPLGVALVLGSQRAAEAGHCAEHVFTAPSCGFDGTRQKLACAQS